MKLFRDTENGYIMSENELMQEFEALKAEQPDEYDYTFVEYVKNCTSKNGFLEAFEGDDECVYRKLTEWEKVKTFEAFNKQCEADATLREETNIYTFEQWDNVQMKVDHVFDRNTYLIIG